MIESAAVRSLLAADGPATNNAPPEAGRRPSIRCKWWELPNSSMRDPTPDAPTTRSDVRRAAALVLGAAEGDVAKVTEVVRNLTQEEEPL